MSIFCYACDIVDIVYIGLLNHQHKEAVLNALEHGKHCLCEKPLGVNAKEVRAMVQKAKERKLFLMEVSLHDKAERDCIFRATGAASSRPGSIFGPVSTLVDGHCSYKPIWATTLMYTFPQSHSLAIFANLGCEQNGASEGRRKPYGNRVLPYHVRALGVWCRSNVRACNCKRAQRRKW